MSLRKRNEVWWIDFRTPNGERVRRSTETGDKRQAQELHDKLKREVWRLQKLGDRPRHIWQDAAVRWLREQAHKATHESDKAKLRWLDKHLAGLDIEEINRAVIDRIIAAKRSEGCTNATVNRVLALVRAILRRCAGEWEWMDRAPAVRLLKEPTRRIRFLTQTEVAILLKELPDHMRDAAVFALATGLRAANVMGLTWQQVDLARKRGWVHPDQAKARRAIPVPFNEAAMEVVSSQVGKHPTHVFTFRGKPLKVLSTKAWYRALKRAGIENFRWHDLRHTWASWHAQNGTPMHVLQELGGWESPLMVRRYAHFATEHLAAYANNAGIVGTNWSQPGS